MSRPYPRRAAAPVPSHSRTSRAEGGASSSRADTPHINPVERFRSEIARRHTGGPRLSRPHPRRATVPAPDYSRTSRAEGGAGTSRADTPHINPAERFRSEIARRHAGGPRLSRPHPRRATVGRHAPRAARVLRAPTRRISTRRNDFEVKSRAPAREGRACRGRTRTERPYPRRTTVGRPAPRAGRRGRRPLPQVPTAIPPVRCAIRPRARRGGRDERFHVGTVPK